MKKSALILNGVILILVLFALSSCGCKHQTTEILDSKDATCTKEGYTGDVFCYDCNTIINIGEVIDRLPHTEELKGVCGATCTESGYSGDLFCTQCNTMIKQGEVITALPHTEELKNVCAATCSSNGNTGDTVCTVCDTVLKKGDIIPSLPHTWETSGVVSATCIKNGYTGDSVCTVCDIIQKGTATPKAAHEFINNVCKHCGWYAPGLYIDGELVLAWNELKNGGYVKVSGGQLKSTQGNFQMGKLVIGEDVTYIDGNYATGFNNDTIKEIWIPQSVTELGNYLIYKNKSIERIVMYCPITQLKKSTFYAGDGLKSIILPDTITYIGESAFQGCDKLKEINIPKSLMGIGREAFWQCGITAIELPEGLETIGLYAFGYSSIKTIKLPSTLKTLDDFAFQNCTNLVSADLSACKSLSTLQYNVFRDCVSLSVVKMPPNLKSIDKACFYGCKSLKFLKLPNKLTSIGKSAFKDSGLVEVVIPTSLIQMGGLETVKLSRIKYRGSEAQWKLSSGYATFVNIPIEYNYND